MKRTAITLVLVVLGTSCNQPAEPTSTTSLGAGVSTVTTLAQTTTTEAPTTTVLGQSVEAYEVAHEAALEEGEQIFVVIPAGSYTDIDLEGFVARLVDERGPLWEAHVFDDATAAAVALKPEAERTEEENQLLADHYLVRLVEGNRIQFQGPFEESGEFVLGS